MIRLPCPLTTRGEGVFRRSRSRIIPLLRQPTTTRWGRSHGKRELCGWRIDQAHRTANGGYTFDHWGGADSVSVHNDTLTMPSHNAAVKAIFKSVAVTYYTFVATTNNDTMGRSHRQAGIMRLRIDQAHQDGQWRVYVRPLGGADSVSVHNDTLTMPSHNAAVKAIFQVGRGHVLYLCCDNQQRHDGVGSHGKRELCGWRIDQAHQDGQWRYTFDHWAARTVYRYVMILSQCGPQCGGEGNFQGGRGHVLYLYCDNQQRHDGVGLTGKR